MRSNLHTIKDRTGTVWARARTSVRYGGPIYRTHTVRSLHTDREGVIPRLQTHPESLFLARERCGVRSEVKCCRFPNSREIEMDQFRRERLAAGVGHEIWNANVTNALPNRVIGSRDRRTELTRQGSGSRGVRPSLLSRARVFTGGAHA